MVSLIFIVLVGGYTECDRSDCGRTGAFLEVAWPAALILLAATTAAAFVDGFVDLYRARRGRE